MCHKIIFEKDAKSYQIGFENQDAFLPILTKSGEIQLMTWGRKKHESGNLPLGGLVLLDAIYAGEWDIFFPKPIKLPIKSFCMRDYQGKTHWYHLSKDKWIQGLIARDAIEKRAYIVALSPDEGEFLRWPRILYG